jgi:hypothetical protein
MKASIFVVSLMLFLVGCTPQQSDQLTQQQKDQIRSEVKAVGDSIVARIQRVDGMGAAKYYADSPEWVMFGADGARWDYKMFMKAQPEFDSTVASWKWTTTAEDFIFITKDVVIAAWSGKDETIMKSGDKIICEPHAYTLVFKKIASEWKIVYSHDSGIPVMQKVGKK